MPPKPNLLFTQEAPIITVLVGLLPEYLFAWHCSSWISERLLQEGQRGQQKTMVEYVDFVMLALSHANTHIIPKRRPSAANALFLCRINPKRQTQNYN